MTTRFTIIVDTFTAIDRRCCHMTHEKTIKVGMQEDIHVISSMSLEKSYFRTNDSIVQGQLVGYFLAFSMRFHPRLLSILDATKHLHVGESATCSRSTQSRQRDTNQTAFILLKQEYQYQRPH